MPQPGAKNLITDVPGFTVGHATDEKAATGVTVLRCAGALVSAADIRGGAPGARETDVLSPENLVGRADAFVLTGGSVFGLAAADGATAALSKAGVGLTLSGKGPAIPIVPAAVLHDLANDGDKDWGETPPYYALGAEAVGNATEDFALGAVGAGRGAMAGRVKGGLGSASVVLDNGVTVGALVAANPVGSVFMPDGKTFYAWPWEQDDEFGGQAPPHAKDDADPFPVLSRLGQGPNTGPKPGANTTLAAIAVSADLTNVEAKRVAVMAHDGIARAVRPAHTPLDGDIVFAAASGVDTLTEEGFFRAAVIAAIGAAAGDCLARAIARAVYEAKG